MITTVLSAEKHENRYSLDSELESVKSRVSILPTILYTLFQMNLLRRQSSRSPCPCPQSASSGTSRPPPSCTSRRCGRPRGRRPRNPRGSSRQGGCSRAHRRPPRPPHRAPGRPCRPPYALPIRRGLQPAHAVV